MAARSDLIFSGEAPAAAAPDQYPSQRLRTIVVDDSDTFLQVTCDLLDREDIINLVAAASDGVEAVDTVARLQPELVLMDVSMPGLDGISTASILAEMSPTPIVVLMSAEDTPRLRADCRSAGAFDFVHKANFHDEFEAVLQRLLRSGGPHAIRETA